MKKIVIASDSFKGSLSSEEVASAVEKGIKFVVKDCEVVKVSVADGGEGTTESLIKELNAELYSVEVCNPLMETITTRYAISKESTTAIMEMASASGLTLIEQSRRNPMLTSTYGTGEMIKDAIEQGCRKILIGIGGSATNDGGMGMLSALGYRFLDSNGNVLSGRGEDLIKVKKIDSSNIIKGLKETKFLVACDVNNPFYGENGAAYIYSPQKGANSQQVIELDKGLKNFSDVIIKDIGVDISKINGAGAAGGLGGAFLAFLNSDLKKGIDLVLESINFSDKIKGADLVITGEGKIDKQTLMGKTPQGVLNYTKKQKIKCIALCGSVDEWRDIEKGEFLATFSITPHPVTLNQALDKEFSMDNIERVTVQIIKLLTANLH